MWDFLQNEWVINIGGAIISGIILEIMMQCISERKKRKEEKKKAKKHKEIISIANETNEELRQNTIEKVIIQEKKTFVGGIVDFIKFLVTSILRIIVIAIVFLGVSLIIFSLKEDKTSAKEVESIQWIILDMGYLIPEPKSDKVDISSNSKELLNIDVYEMTENDCYAYVYECENNYGFNIDVEKVGSSFWAYNEEGYRLNIMHINDHVSISLECPIEFAEYEIPEYAVDEGLPLPKSKLGYFEWEYDDNFNIKIGNTSFEEYQKYVKECISAGFIEDSQEGKDFYNGDNKSGYELSIHYIGYNTMSIDFDSPEE